jgi:hypothetical protein
LRLFFFASLRLGVEAVAEGGAAEKLTSLYAVKKHRI